MGNLKIKEWEIGKLIQAEYNPRILKEHQYKALKDSIERYGIVDPILVNVNPDRYGIIIGGHQRTMVAEKMGLKKVPCVELDLTLEREKELNIRLNKNTGEWDYDSLANYFEKDNLIEWGFNDYEFGITEDVDLDNFFEDDTTEPKEEKNKIILEYTEEEHEKVINALSELGNTPEQAVWKLLGFEK